ncbi:MAG: hypothetical protein LRS48_06605 [Desulfurococcales archaeon]|nr:hypothetical protein [Desulfurococcales archaeon]
MRRPLPATPALEGMRKILSRVVVLLRAGPGLEAWMPLWGCKDGARGGAYR